MKKAELAPESRTEAAETRIPRPRSRRDQDSGGAGVGEVRTEYLRFAEPPHAFILESGERLSPVTVAYETYGTLNEERSNAILILHALSGDAHAAGYHHGETKPGWWDEMIGPEKAFDTNRYFVISSNVLGGCRGTTGPSSIDPASGKRYDLGFPLITIPDMVNVQRRLIDHLGINQLLAVAGGSMGGMQGLEWMVSHPDRSKSAILIATAARHSPQQIAFNEVGRQAIMADPQWRGGSYDGHPPSKGLAVARMIGHVTYMSDLSMAEKFGRRVRNSQPAHRFSSGFEVEEYLHHKGNHFVKRFDANSYLYLTYAMDTFDLSRGRDLHAVFCGLSTRVLLLAFKSDWLYPASQVREIARSCKVAGVDTTYCEIDSNYGHDAFLLEIEEESHMIRHFLRRVAGERTAAHGGGAE